MPSQGSPGMLAEQECQPQGTPVPLGFSSLRVPRNGRQPPQWLPLPPVPQQRGVLSRPSASRDWYMNGNYLVILVSVTIILPLALMKQLGKSGRCHPWHRGLAPWVSRGVMVPAWMCWARWGHLASARVPPAPTGHSPPSPGYLGYASGFSLSCMVFFLISVSTRWHLGVPSIPPAGV